MAEECEKPTILVLIPARGGSKGVPRKALRILGDMPLIAYTIRDALAIDGITKVFVSTDDPEIRMVAMACGAEVPFLRPSDLAQDDSKLEDAIEYTMTRYREEERFVPDIQIVMSPTHPFRRPRLINDALRFALSHPDIMNIGSVAPWNGNLSSYRRVDEKTGTWRPFFQNIQHISSEFFQSAFSFNIVFLSRLHLPSGRVPVVLNDIESIDIDEPEDLDLARMVLYEGLYPFDESC